MKRSYVAWLYPLAWMGLIFFLSSRQRVSVSEEYILNFMFFKTLHLIEYFVLYILLARASLGTWKPTRRALLTAVAIAALYAVSDEIHQTFVPTRQGAIRDVGIDSISILFGYFLCMKYQALLKKSM